MSAFQKLTNSYEITHTHNHSDLDMFRNAINAGRVPGVTDDTGIAGVRLLCIEGATQIESASPHDFYLKVVREERLRMSYERAFALRYLLGQNRLARAQKAMNVTLKEKEDGADNYNL